MKPMIRITGRAAKRLKDTLTCRARTPNQCLRLVLVPGGQAGLVLDKAGEGDEVIEVGGDPLLIFDPVLASVLEGATLDCQDTAEGPQLILVK